MVKQQRHTGMGGLIGFVIGFIFDMFIAVRYNPGCQTTKLQEFLGITPFCTELYFLGIWFAIVGGFIGYFIKTKK